LRTSAVIRSTSTSPGDSTMSPDDLLSLFRNISSSTMSETNESKGSTLLRADHGTDEGADGFRSQLLWRYVFLEGTFGQAFGHLSCYLHPNHAHGTQRSDRPGSIREDPDRCLPPTSCVAPRRRPGGAISHRVTRDLDRRSAAAARSCLDQGRSVNDSTCWGRTTLKWRWSRVATSLMLRRSAMATTEASTMPRGKSP